MQRLATALNATGRYEARLSGRVDFKYALLAYRPHAVIVGKHDHVMGDHLRCIDDSYIVSVNTEQGGLSDLETIDQFITGHSYPRGPAHDRVDAFLLTDESTRQTLEPYLGNDRLHVIGYLRLLQTRYATSARPLTRTFTVGLACGPNIVIKEAMASLYESYPTEYPGDWRSVEDYIAYTTIEWLLLNQVSEMLRDKSKQLVRLRYADDDYLINSRALEIDDSSDPKYFFEQCDLIITGQSTIAVEAMMAGIPAISLSKYAGQVLRDRGDFSHVETCWQPTSMEAVKELVELRRKDELGLTPDPVGYQEFVSRTFYCAGETDRSVLNTIELLDQASYKEQGAKLDIGNLCELLNINRRELLVLKLIRRVPAILFLKMVLYYQRIRWRDLSYQMYFPPVASASRRNRAV